MNLHLFQISKLRTIALKVMGLKHTVRMPHTDYINGTGKRFYTVFPQKKSSPSPPPHTHKSRIHGIYYLYFDSA